jgi:hypothetical protein
MKAKFLIILLFSFLNGYSQKQENECMRMIDSAISIRVNEFSIQEKKANAINSLLKDLYLINENDLPYSYSSALADVKFKYMNIYSPKSKKVLKKGISAWKILTSLTKDTFNITIIDFKITYKNGNYNYVNGGGSKTFFRYSCQENKWILIESKNSGI